MRIHQFYFIIFWHYGTFIACTKCRPHQATKGTPGPCKTCSSFLLGIMLQRNIWWKFRDSQGHWHFAFPCCTAQRALHWAAPLLLPHSPHTRSSGYEERRYTATTNTNPWYATATNRHARSRLTSLQWEKQLWKVIRSAWSMCPTLQLLSCKKLQIRRRLCYLSVYVLE